MESGHYICRFQTPESKCLSARTTALCRTSPVQHSHPNKAWEDTHPAPPCKMAVHRPMNRATTFPLIRTSGSVPTSSRMLDSIGICHLSFVICYYRDFVSTMSQQDGTCPHPGCSCLIYQASSQAELNGGMPNKLGNYVTEGLTRSLRR